ncbi:nucleoside kinase [Thermosediminibacter oceani]|uniref:Phosphoribulokinase/uridine kinase n=1 Tax=Thermosediminibacter oceani (strain ATCC BAA-1034 / DSM 16646 / JW/IW-1228P) TaxID=555079 RepID=D9RYC0_THEOJ|nr:nucleoside kinase [Thermosediminibacter oceani]ADL08344.1 phosphoribulokinase/uridine kinase [Thermosediminibacter oceani DSM 16646]
MRVFIKGIGERSYEGPVTFLEISREVQAAFSSPVAAAVMGNRVYDLEHTLTGDADIEFLDLSTEIGMRIYLRTLVFIFIKACGDVLPGSRVHVEHSIGDGIYCEVYWKEPIGEDDVESIEKRMRELVDKDIPIVKRRMAVEDAAIEFKKMGWDDKVRVLKYVKKDYVDVYELDGLKGFFPGYLLPSTGYVQWFKLKFYLPGIILQHPRPENPTELPTFKEQPKLFKVIRESERWAHILGVADAGALNDYITSGRAGEIIRIAEALHEKKIAQIADTISENRDMLRVILIAGPSSSGKTTFAQRLMVQLRVNGLRPVSISLDDYFVDRDKTPLDSDGKPDFEALEAIDLKLFNQHLAALIQGKEVYLPKYNFITGKREFQKFPVKIDKDQPILVEGIHALNEKLTFAIPKEDKFKIYVSALTQLSIDNHNYISTTDTRLLRRIVRDSRTRGADARMTIAMWPSVQKGARKHIFSFQEEADVMFNSALVYEFAVLKKYAEPLLREIKPEHPEYVTAGHLLKLLEYFEPLEDEWEIPATSIIREFVGSSCFRVG